MIAKDHNPNINEPIRVMGVNFQDLLTLTLLLFAYMLVIGVVDVIFGFSSAWLYLLGLTIFPTALFGLKYANKQGEKDFIDSWVAYYLYQPKHIKPFDPNVYQYNPSDKEVC